MIETSIHSLKKQLKFSYVVFIEEKLKSKIREEKSESGLFLTENPYKICFAIQFNQKWTEEVL